MQQSICFLGIFLFANLLITGSCSPSHGTNQKLFQIWKDNRYGFINQYGDVVIQPIYRNLGRFSNGLAPARLNGTYGYIDSSGTFVIPPKYDYAADFSEGYAKVFQEGKLFFINPKGERLWNVELNTATDFVNGISKVSISQDSKIIAKALDTLGKLHDEDEFLDWDNELAFVKKYIKLGEDPLIGIKHKNGKMLVPFRRYRDIQPFHEGFAEVHYPDTTADENDFQNWVVGFINRRGELAFRLPKGTMVFENYYSEGLLAVYTSVDSNDINSEEYVTWIDTTGKVVFAKRDDKRAMPFITGRSFSGEIRNWYLMDKTGKQLSNNRFEWVGNNDFSKNRVIVAEHDTTQSIPTKEKWGVIDSMGEYLIPPQYDKVCDAEFQKEGLLVAMADEKNNAEAIDPYTGKSYHWGLIDTLGKWLIKPKYTFVHPSGFQDGLLYVEIDSLYGYVNPKGKFVWKSYKPIGSNRKIEPLNIAHMSRGYNYVFPSKYDIDAYGRDSSTADKCVAKSITSHEGFPAGQLGILAKPDLPAVFMEAFNGFKTYIFNTTNDTLKIDVQDNRLYLIVQALDHEGIWRDIEYSPSSWCGNSYYDITLLPNEYWELTTPVYEGDFKTTLRLAFTYQDHYWDQSPPKVIFSNTFTGGVNPAQFWNREEYYSTNIMDPYND